MARASGAGHGDDRVHLPKARAGSSGGGGGGGGGGGHLSRPERVSLTLLRFRGDLQGRRRRHTSSPTSGPACLSTCLGLTARRSLVLRSIACSSRRAPSGRLLPRSSTSSTSVTGSPHSSHEVFHLERLCLSFFVYQVNCSQSRRGDCKCNVSHRKHEPKRTQPQGFFYSSIDD